jgi:hypothetical protein
MTTLFAIVGAGSAIIFLGLLTLAPLGWIVILFAVTIGAH